MASELEKLKQYFDAQLKEMRQEFMADNGEIKSQVQAGIAATDNLKSVMNGRVKKLEIKEARREGAESVTKPTSGISMISKNVIAGVVALAIAAVALARTIVEYVIKDAPR